MKILNEEIKGLLKIMKRPILIITLIIILIDIICIFKYDFSSKRGDIIYKLILEGSISGIITFSGLIFTFFWQEKIARCPCIIIKQIGISQAKTEYQTIDKKDCVDCCTNGPQFVRKVEVHIINVKDSWAVNCSISGVVQGAISSGVPIKRTFILPSSDQEDICGKIELKFQDVYGKTYRQIVDFFQNETEYIFVSNQPVGGA